MTLTAVVHGPLSADSAQITGTDSAGGTYLVFPQPQDASLVGALGTGPQFAVGDKALIVALTLENVSVLNLNVLITPDYTKGLQYNIL